MADIGTPEKLQLHLNSQPVEIRSLYKKEITKRGTLAQIGDCSIHTSKLFICPDFYIAIRSFPEVTFFVFSTEEEAVNYCLDRFEPQLKLFNNDNSNEK